MKVICLADCATTHTILRDKRYFLDLTLTNANVSIIFGTANLIAGSERANIMLLNGTRFYICKTRENSIFFKKNKTVISVENP